MSRFQTILVPTDFSDHSRAALELAIELARTARAKVHLLHAYELPLTTISPYGVAMPEPLLAEVRDAAARRLEKACQEVRGAGLVCETHVTHAFPGAAIAEAARTLSADLIVMSTHGHTGLKHALLGSVAERTVRSAPCPVLTLRARDGREGAREKPSGRFRRILVPLDFSKHADAALDLALELGREHGAEVHLFHAYELPTAVTMAYGIAVPQTVWDGIQEAAVARLAQGLDRIEKAGLKGKSHLATGPAADTIVDAAETHHAELIVMGTRGLTGLKHVLLGSVAERTIRLAPCPVLTVKADEGSRESAA
jgi:nucleotide-binding universal stress UspA family protein